MDSIQLIRRQLVLRKSDCVFGLVVRVLEVVASRSTHRYGATMNVASRIVSLEISANNLY